MPFSIPGSPLGPVPGFGRRRTVDEQWAELEQVLESSNLSGSIYSYTTGELGVSSRQFSVARQGSGRIAGTVSVDIDPLLGVMIGGRPLTPNFGRGQANQYEALMGIFTDLSNEGRVSAMEEIYGQYTYRRERITPTDYTGGPVSPAYRIYEASAFTLGLEGPMADRSPWSALHRAPRGTYFDPREMRDPTAAGQRAHNLDFLNYIPGFGYYPGQAGQEVYSPVSGSKIFARIRNFMPDPLRTYNIYDTPENLGVSALYGRKIAGENLPGLVTNMAFVPGAAMPGAGQIPVRNWGETTTLAVNKAMTTPLSYQAMADWGAVGGGAVPIATGLRRGLSGPSDYMTRVMDQEVGLDPSIRQGGSVINYRGLRGVMQLPFGPGFLGAITPYLSPEAQAQLEGTELQYEGVSYKAGILNMPESKLGLAERKAQIMWRDYLATIDPRYQERMAGPGMGVDIGAPVSSPQIKMWASIRTAPESGMAPAGVAMLKGTFNYGGMPTGLPESTQMLITSEAVKGLPFLAQQFADTFGREGMIALGQAIGSPVNIGAMWDVQGRFRYGGLQNAPLGEYFQGVLSQANRVAVNQVMQRYGAGIQTIPTLETPIDPTTAAFYQRNLSMGVLGAFAGQGTDVVQRGGAFFLQQHGLEGITGLRGIVGLSEAPQRYNQARTSFQDIFELAQVQPGLAQQLLSNAANTAVPYLNLGLAVTGNVPIGQMSILQPGMALPSGREQAMAALGASKQWRAIIESGRVPLQYRLQAMAESQAFSGFQQLNIPGGNPLTLPPPSTWLGGGGRPGLIQFDQFGNPVSHEGRLLDELLTALQGNASYTTLGGLPVEMGESLRKLAQNQGVVRGGLTGGGVAGSVTGRLGYVGGLPGNYIVLPDQVYEQVAGELGLTQEQVKAGEQLVGTAMRWPSGVFTQAKASTASLINASTARAMQLAGGMMPENAIDPSRAASIAVSSGATHALQHGDEDKDILGVYGAVRALFPGVNFDDQQRLAIARTLREVNPGAFTRARAALAQQLGVSPSMIPLGAIQPEVALSYASETPLSTAAPNEQLGKLSDALLATMTRRNLTDWFTGLRHQTGSISEMSLREQAAVQALGGIAIGRTDVQGFMLRQLMDEMGQSGPNAAAAASRIGGVKQALIDVGKIPGSGESLTAAGNDMARLLIASTLSLHAGSRGATINYEQIGQRQVINTAEGQSILVPKRLTANDPNDIMMMQVQGLVKAGKLTADQIATLLSPGAKELADLDPELRSTVRAIAETGEFHPLPQAYGGRTSTQKIQTWASTPLGATAFGGAFLRDIAKAIRIGERVAAGETVSEREWNQYKAVEADVASGAHDDLINLAERTRVITRVTGNAPIIADDETQFGTVRTKEEEAGIVGEVIRTSPSSTAGILRASGQFKDIEAAPYVPLTERFKNLALRVQAGQRRMAALAAGEITTGADTPVQNRGDIVLKASQLGSTIGDRLSSALGLQDVTVPMRAGTAVDEQLRTMRPGQHPERAVVVGMHGYQVAVTPDEVDVENAQIIDYKVTGDPSNPRPSWRYQLSAYVRAAMTGVFGGELGRQWSGGLLMSTPEQAQRAREAIQKTDTKMLDAEYNKLASMMGNAEEWGRLTRVEQNGIKARMLQIDNLKRPVPGRAPRADGGPVPLTGRWFTTDLANAQRYADEMGSVSGASPVITFVDVKAESAEQWKLRQLRENPNLTAAEKAELETIRDPETEVVAPTAADALRRVPMTPLTKPVAKGYVRMYRGESGLFVPDLTAGPDAEGISAVAREMAAKAVDPQKLLTDQEFGRVLEAAYQREKSMPALVEKIKQGFAARGWKIEDGKITGPSAPDSREALLNAYSKILGQDVTATPDLGITASLGKPITPGTELRPAWNTSARARAFQGFGPAGAGVVQGFLNSVLAGGDYGESANAFNEAMTDAGIGLGTQAKVDRAMALVSRLRQEGTLGGGAQLTGQEKRLLQEMQQASGDTPLAETFKNIRMATGNRILAPGEKPRDLVAGAELEAKGHDPKGTIAQFYEELKTATEKVKEFHTQTGDAGKALESAGKAIRDYEKIVSPEGAADFFKKAGGRGPTQSLAYEAAVIGAQADAAQKTGIARILALAGGDTSGGARTGVAGELQAGFENVKERLSGERRFMTGFDLIYTARMAGMFATPFAQAGEQAVAEDQQMQMLLAQRGMLSGTGVNPIVARQTAIANQMGTAGRAWQEAYGGILSGAQGGALGALGPMAGILGTGGAVGLTVANLIPKTPQIGAMAGALAIGAGVAGWIGAQSENGVANAAMGTDSFWGNAGVGAGWVSSGIKGTREQYMEDVNLGRTVLATSMIPGASAATLRGAYGDLWGQATQEMARLGTERGLWRGVSAEAANRTMAGLAYLGGADVDMTLGGRTPDRVMRGPTGQRVIPGTTTPMSADIEAAMRYAAQTGRIATDDVSALYQMRTGAFLAQGEMTSAQLGEVTNLSNAPGIERLLALGGPIAGALQGADISAAGLQIASGAGRTDVERAAALISGAGRLQAAGGLSQAEVLTRAGFRRIGAGRGFDMTVMPGQTSLAGFQAAEMATQLGTQAMGRYGAEIGGNLANITDLGQLNAIAGGNRYQMFQALTGAGLTGAVAAATMNYEPQALPGGAAIGGSPFQWQGTSAMLPGMTSAQTAQMFGIRDQALLGGWTGTQIGQTGISIGGIAGMQYAAQQASYSRAMAGIGIQMQGIQLRHQYTTGEGMPGGRGFWQIEDDFTSLQRRQQDFSYELQGRSMAMQERQWTAGFQAQVASSRMQRGWQMQDFGTQAARTAQTRQWMREDWGVQDDVRALQWGWNQEDMAENIRFSTGRQRRVAVRERERATTMHNIEDESIDRDRKRIQEQEKWKDEDFKKEKQRAAEIDKIREANFDRAKKDFQENMELQKEQHKMEKQFRDEARRLEDEQRKLQREFFLKQEELQKASLALQASAIAQQKQMGDAMLAIQTVQAVITAANEKMPGDAQTVADNLNKMLANVPVGLHVSVTSSGQLQLSVDGGVSGNAGTGGSHGGSGGGPQELADIDVASGGGSSGGGDEYYDEPGHAFGGPAIAGRPVKVGEQGEEIFIPDSSGMIVPTSRFIGMPFGTQSRGSGSGSSGVSMAGGRDTLVVIKALTNLVTELQRVNPDSAKAVKNTLAVLAVS